MLSQTREGGKKKKRSLSLFFSNEKISPEPATLRRGGGGQLRLAYIEGGFCSTLRTKKEGSLPHFRLAERSSTECGRPGVRGEMVFFRRLKKIGSRGLEKK